MSPADIIFHRLLNQHIAASQLTTAPEVVNKLAAMQAQEYAMSKWAIGLRLPGSRDKDIETAFNRGEILRTHLLRPTWHFVTPENIRWMLQLTAPRVHAINAFMYRKTELDDKIFKRCHKIISKALEGNRHLTRESLNTELERHKIISDGVRSSCIMMHAELEGLICSGPRQGKQFTYALLEERVPAAKRLARTEALLKLTDLYFRSRGPATLQDYVTWSGLTVKDTKAGIADLSPEFSHGHIEGKDYIFIPREIPDMKKLQTTFLMPDYDEYGMGYKDRTAIFNAEKHKRAISRNNPIFNRMIIINGRIEGTWQRLIKGKTLSVHTVPFEPLGKAAQRSLQAAVKAFKEFSES
jgi:hypothetical protein